MTYSRQNLPTPGQLIEIDIAWVSRCCGPTLVGFFYGSDDVYIYLSDHPNQGRVEKVAWSSVLKVQKSNAFNSICIDP